jgi:hypothetical protein
MTTVQFPGAERRLAITTSSSAACSIAVHEWGDESAEPLFLVHGGFDFARTYDEFAPRSPAPAGVSSPGTNAATATASTPRSTAGTPTSATRSG